MQRTSWFFAALTCVLTAGCGGSDFAVVSVSGKVTLDGEPLAGAAVNFLPFAGDHTEEAGPPSAGITDDQGVFRLTVADGREGAVVGKHRVMIFSQNIEASDDGGSEDEEGPSDDVYGDSQELVPARYNVASELIYEVLAEGASDANFDLTSG